MCVPLFREDVDNVDGGMWVIKVEKRHTVSCTDFGIPMYVVIRYQAKVWQELLLAAIGEQLSVSIHPDDEVCGVSVRIRHDYDVIQIWNQYSHLSSEAKASSSQSHLSTLHIVAGFEQG